MNLQNEQKLKDFAHFTVVHPEYHEALNIFHRSTEATRLRGEPTCVMLMGDPGTGKTRVCDDIIAEYPQPSTLHTDKGVHVIHPVIYCRVPNNATIKTLVLRLLAGFESYHKYQSADSLEFRLMKILDTCGTSLIILDEWQHLLRSGSDRALKMVADWVKVLTDVFRGEVMLVGSEGCEKLLEMHQALADRFPFRARLKGFSLNTEESYATYLKLIRAFANQINVVMGFDETVAITDEKMTLALFVSTGGNMRELRMLLHDALSNGFNRNDGTLLIEDFALGVDHLKLSARLTNHNAFTMNLGELNNIINKSVRKNNA